MYFIRRAANRFAASLAACGVMGLSGCVTPNPQTASVAAQPTSPIVKNITSFTNSLRCMDDLFLSYGTKNIVITSDGLPDQTGQITTGTKEMMISAISKMSAKSGAIVFVDVDRTQDAVFWIQQNWIGVRDGLVAPNYYIRGAITQVDAGVMSDSVSAGFSQPSFSIGVSKDQIVSVVSMDMNIGNIINRQILPGMSLTNSIAVAKSGKGGDTEGLIQKAGLFFEISSDRSQGSHQSVRTLVELGLIELLGKFTKVPYWRCLEIDSTNPEMIAQARDWYDTLTLNEQVKLAQTALKMKGLYRGSEDGKHSSILSNAINRYKFENDLIADGRIDFDLYYSFMANDLLVDSGTKRAGFKPQQGSASKQPIKPHLGKVTLQMKPLGGRNKQYSVGEKLEFDVSVAKDAYVYCYYHDGNETVARIFPNRFQENNLVRPNTSVRIPSKSAPFSIKFENSGIEEQVACIATEQDYGAKKPFVLDDADLSPLEVTSLREVVEQHMTADRFYTTVQHAAWQVR